jgi:hypothetical protein
MMVAGFDWCGNHIFAMAERSFDWRKSSKIQWTSRPSGHSLLPI